MTSVLIADPAAAGDVHDALVALPQLDLPWVTRAETVVLNTYATADPGQVPPREG